MRALQWDRSLGTTKRDQNIVTPKLPKTKRQLSAAKRIAEKADAQSE